MVQVMGLNVVGAIREALAASAEPLTLARLRRALPMPLQSLPVEVLTDVLRRQVAAHVFVLYPKYRSRQDRYWDRPLHVHLEQLLRKALRAGPLPWSEIRRRLPDYAKIRAESLLEEQVARGRMFRHPAFGRQGPRYGLAPASLQRYVWPEFDAMLRRLQALGFSRQELRASALECLREEERAAAPTPRNTAAINYTMLTESFDDDLDCQLVALADS